MTSRTSVRLLQTNPITSSRLWRATVRPRTVTIGRSASPYAGRVAAANRQPNRVGAIGTRNRLSNPRISTARNRESFNSNHVFARHDGNWHRDWDKHRGHFSNGHWWAWYGGSWLGLDAGFYPWDLYDYGYYPYDYYGGNPDDYSGYYPDDYNDPSSYEASAQSPNNDTVSGVQSQLAKQGYYNGAIDGVLGDETEAALARYPEDHNLSVTGTVTAATLQSLGTNKGS
jgi:Putative peptidoglycan binding domain